MRGCRAKEDLEVVRKDMAIEKARATELRFEVQALRPNEGNKEALEKVKAQWNMDTREHRRGRDGLWSQISKLEEEKKAERKH